MSANSNAAAPQRPRHPWFQIGRFLLLAASAVVVFLLVQSMVHHRFFRGGRIDQFGHLRQK
jgi:hypothetical protein